MGRGKDICCIFNLGPHYNYPLYSAMGRELECDFCLGDHIHTEIKIFDYPSLPGYQKTLHNRYFGPFYWQDGALSQLFQPYRYYILTGEPYCLSHWVLLLLSKFTRKKVFGWTHGWYGRESFLKKAVKKAFFQLFDHLLVYSEYAMGLMREEGIRASKMTCIANSLDSERMKDIRCQLQPTDVYKKHFGNDHPVIIYCGRIQKVKKLESLVDAVDMLARQGKPVNLIMIGKDVDGTNLEAYVAEKHLQSSVWFYGPCYEESVLAELFYNASVCVSPGNIGLTAIHSLSYGCPVVTHDDFTLQMPEFESVIPGMTGDFFEYGNINDIVEKINTWAHKVNRDHVRSAAFREIDRKWNIQQQITTLKALFGL